MAWWPCPGEWRRANERLPYRTLFPFFDGLIPEGWLLNLATRNWKVDQADRFGLLLIACEDCIGNVSIREGDGDAGVGAD